MASETVTQAPYTAIAVDNLNGADLILRCCRSTISLVSDKLEKTRDVQSWGALIGVLELLEQVQDNLQATVQGLEVSR